MINLVHNLAWLKHLWISRQGMASELVYWECAERKKQNYFTVVLIICSISKERGIVPLSLFPTRWNFSFELQTPFELFSRYAQIKKILNLINLRITSIFEISTLKLTKCSLSSHKFHSWWPCPFSPPGLYEPMIITQSGFKYTCFSE